MKIQSGSIHSRSRLSVAVIFVLMVISSPIVSLVMIETEVDSAFGSTEISRTYEKTVSSSIHKSLRNLEDTNDLNNWKDNATYRVQFDEQGRQVVNVTVIDYAEPPSPRITTDDCGDGSNQFTTNNGGVRWMQFPVSYAVDPANSGVAPTATTNAFIAAFNHFDTRMPGEAFIQTTNFDSADIKVRWQFLDGEGGQLGLASWTFIPSTLEITSAAITLDSGDSWFVASSESCGQTGNLFDIQNVGSHELGHAVGLGHVTDNLLTMYPNSFAGETLRRSLGTGDKDGLSFLYGSVQAPLQIPRTLQSNDLVNSLAFYEVTFITSTSGAIDRIRIDFPAGTNIAAAGVIERVGVGGGTLLKSGSSITYDVTTPLNIPAGTFIRLEMFGIKNPSIPSASLTATITTRDNGGNLIDGPSQTNVYTVKQIGSNDMAEIFMKRGRAIDDAAGNAAGWNPNGITTTFTISEPAVSSYVESFIMVEVVQTMGQANHSCDPVKHSPGLFTIICSSPPPNASDLNYVIFNLPPHTL